MVCVNMTNQRANKHVANNMNKSSVCVNMTKLTIKRRKLHGCVNMTNQEAREELLSHLLQTFFFSRVEKCSGGLYAGGRRRMISRSVYVGALRLDVLSDVWAMVWAMNEFRSNERERVLGLPSGICRRGRTGVLRRRGETLPRSTYRGEVGRFCAPLFFFSFSVLV